MEHKLAAGSQTSSGAVLGALLVVAGLFFLVVRFASFDLTPYAWPVAVVGAGFAMLFVGLIVRSAVGLVIPGSILLTVGSILAVQNAFGLWATWSYAWTLVFPTSVGIGIAIMGLARRDRAQAGQGAWMAAVGMSLFVVFAMFFEGLLHVGGLELGVAGSVLFPLLLIVFGVALIFVTALRGRTA